MGQRIWWPCRVSCVRTRHSCATCSVCTRGSVSSQSPGAMTLRSGISTGGCRRTRLWRSVRSGRGVKAEVWGHVWAWVLTAKFSHESYRQENEGTGLFCAYSPHHSVTYDSKVAGNTLQIPLLKIMKARELKNYGKTIQPAISEPQSTKAMA